MFGSLNNIQDETGDSFSTISNENNKTSSSINSEFNEAFDEIEAINDQVNIQREINNGISDLNRQLLLIQTLYLGYLSDVNQNAAGQYGFASPLLINERENLIGLVSQVTDPELDAASGNSIMNLIDLEIDNFLDIGDNIFDLISSTVVSDIKSTFTNFTNSVNTKIANLVQWMYSSNDTLLLNSIIAETHADSSFANNLNDSIIPIDEDHTTNPQIRALNSQLANISGQLNQLYVDMIPSIYGVITEVNLAGNDPTLFDQTEINLQISMITTFTQQINNITQNVLTLMEQQEGNLEIEIFAVNSSFQLLSTSLQGLFLWSEAASDILSANVNTIRENSRTDLEDTINNSTSLLDELIRNSNEALQDITDSVNLVMLFILAASLAFIAILIFIANLQISKPIKQISYWSEKISEGDLSYNDYRSSRTDEIGVLHNNFRIMNKNLKDIIVEVQDSSSIISNTADDLSSNTQEINATAEEVSAIAQSMAKGSTQQAEQISTIVEELQITSEIVDDVISQINYNLRIIHELSEQTNVLALNTAIEAANAGEFGRGFAVISESIRKMASQSKKTTEEVTKDSRDVLLQLQTTFSNITGKIENVAAVSEETAASAEEVAASAEELTAVMETVSTKSSMLNERSSQSSMLISHFVLERDESNISNGNGDPAKALDTQEDSTGEISDLNDEFDTVDDTEEVNEQTNLKDEDEISEISTENSDFEEVSDNENGQVETMSDDPEITDSDEEHEEPAKDMD
ncbi:MAG: methyl-accepting chemotaxis protein [Candidatus Kariarchaeaceae archaeon]|jgi:methyl-accepting chemotaxis protein